MKAPLFLLMAIFVLKIQATKLLAQTPSEFYRLGETELVAAGDIDKAVEYLTKAIEGYENKEENIEPEGLGFVYFWRANAYRRQEEWQNAIEDYLQSIKLSPDSPSAYKGLSLVHTLLEEHEKSIEILNTGIHAISDSSYISGLLIERGKAHYRMRNWESAFVDFDKSVALNSKNCTAMQLRGMVRIDLVMVKGASSGSKLIAAENDANLLARTCPNSHLYHELKGLILLFQGKEKEALSFFKEAINISPENAGIAELYIEKIENRYD